MDLVDVCVNLTGSLLCFRLCILQAISAHVVYKLLRACLIARNEPHIFCYITQFFSCSKWTSHSFTGIIWNQNKWMETNCQTQQWGISCQFWLNKQRLFNSKCILNKLANIYAWFRSLKGALHCMIICIKSKSRKIYITSTTYFQACFFFFSFYANVNNLKPNTSHCAWAS